MKTVAAVALIIVLHGCAAFEAVYFCARIPHGPGFCP